MAETSGILYDTRVACVKSRILWETSRLFHRRTGDHQDGHMPKTLHMVTKNTVTVASKNYADLTSLV